MVCTVGIALLLALACLRNSVDFLSLWVVRSRTPMMSKIDRSCQGDRHLKVGSADPTACVSLNYAQLLWLDRTSIAICKQNLWLNIF